jgi:DNA polymerase III alpha subunit
VVITPGPITDYTHVNRSPLGYPVAAWDRESAAAARMVKIDLLGNRSLSVFRDTLRLLRDTAHSGGTPGANQNQPWLPKEILADGPTRNLVARGDTLGLFYVESPACRQLLRKMSRGDYPHLIIAGSIIRPAASATIRSFLKRLHGAPYRSATPVLDQSYGLMVYQEDIARVTGEAARFDPALADGLRRTLAGKAASADLEAYRRLFFSRGLRLGNSREALEELWDMIRSFRGYSFCKSHSASYALVSYQLAYLKRHHPLEFFLSVINNGGGYYSRQTYLNECRRLGIPLMLPDVNRSRFAYTAEQGGIRVGLSQIRSVSRPFLNRLLAERQRRGPFTDPSNLFHRLDPALKEVRILVRCGAMDGICGAAARPQILWKFLSRRSTQELFPPEYPPRSDYPEELKALDELRTLGLMITRHPVSLFRRRAAALARDLGYPRLIPSSELPRSAGREVSLVGLVASGKEVRASGALMVFVTLEDEFSLFETVLFPGVFSRYRQIMEGGGVLLVYGGVQRDMGAFSLTVRGVSRMDGEADRRTRLARGVLA